MTGGLRKRRKSPAFSGNRRFSGKKKKLLDRRIQESLESLDGNGEGVGLALSRLQNAAAPFMAEVIIFVAAGGQPLPRLNAEEGGVGRPESDVVEGGKADPDASAGVPISQIHPAGVQVVKNDGVHFVVISVPQGQGLGVGEKGTAGVHVDLSGFFVIEGAAVFFRLLKFHFVVFKPAAGGILKGNPDGRMGAEAVGHLPVAIVFHLHGEGNAVFQDGVGGTKGETEGIQLQGLLVLGEGEDGGVAFGFFHCPFVVSGETVGIHAVGLAVKVGGSVPQVAGEGEKEGGNASPISWVAVPEVVVSAGGEAPQLCPVGGDHGDSSRAVLPYR